MGIYMDYKQYILSKLYVGELFKFALSKNIDIYKFTISFLKSDFKEDIDLGKIELNELNFENNFKVKELLSKTLSGDNESYKKHIPYKIYDFVNIIIWIGETVQCWSIDFKKDGLTISDEFNEDIFKKMIESYSYLCNEDSSYIYDEIYNIHSVN